MSSIYRERRRGRERGEMGGGANYWLQGEDAFGSSRGRKWTLKPLMMLSDR